MRKIKIELTKKLYEEVLPTKNADHGFYGQTAKDYSSKKGAEKRWAEAFVLLRALSNFKPEIIRRYLDSKAGQHLADDIYNKDLRSKIIRKWEKVRIQDDLYSSDYKVSDEMFYEE